MLLSYKILIFNQAARLCGRGEAESVFVELDHEAVQRRSAAVGEGQLVDCVMSQLLGR